MMRKENKVEEKLTHEEITVLKKFIKLGSYKKAAETMDIPIAKIYLHSKNIKAKLHAKNTLNAIYIAVKKNYI